MGVLLRAEEEPAVSRLDYWRHVVGDTIAPLELRVRTPPDFTSHVLLGGVGPLRVGEMTTLPGEAVRTPKLIRRSDPELCKIDVQVRKSTVIEQDGREARLEPGDFTLVDLSRPAHWATSAAQVIAVLFPKALLPLRSDEVARLTAVRFTGGRGAGALVSTLARHLVGQLDDLGAAEGLRLGAAVLDVLTVALAGRLDRVDTVPLDTRQRTLLVRIQAFIEERLGDPALSPASIAAAHHISIRYLYKLFEAQGVSVARLIRQRRLARCRRDLLDPAMRSRPVNAIAQRWGYSSGIQFNRAFRAVYDLPPGEYRRRFTESNPD